MPRWGKILIGLAAALFAGWLSHGPLGGGARFLNAVEAQAKIRVDYAEVPGVAVRMQRDPMARIAILSGPANDFQKEGLRRNGRLAYPGLNERVRTVPGVAAIRWESRGRAFPLVAETLLLSAAAFLVGLGAGRILFGRRPRRSYLD